MTNRGVVIHHSQFIIHNSSRGMTERTQSGLSARQLILFFFAGVAVCAVFFVLGLLVGYNERAPTVAPDTERVTQPSDIPPVVNPPMRRANRAAKSATTRASATA